VNNYADQVLTQDRLTRKPTTPSDRRASQRGKRTSEPTKAQERSSHPGPNLPVVRYAAQLHALGNPANDANGRFIKTFCIWPQALPRCRRRRA
jgi:hypothetical protein